MQKANFSWRQWETQASTDVSTLCGSARLVDTLLASFSRFVVILKANSKEKALDDAKFEPSMNEGMRLHPSTINFSFKRMSNVMEAWLKFLRHDSWSFGTLEIPFGVIKVSSVLYVKDIRHSGLWKRVETSTYQSTLTKRMIPVCLKLDRNLFLQEALSKNTTFEKIPVRLSKIPVGLKVDRNFFCKKP